MAHGLEIFGTGEAAFFTARQPAWHRLGTVTPGALTAEEALRVAHLGDWQVTKRPIMTTAPDGTGLPVTDRFATVRRNPDPLGPGHTVLGVVGNDYEVIQNEEAFAFLTALAGHGDAVFETAGSLDGGRKVFVTMRLPEPLRVAGDDDVDLYVVVTTGHDGSAGFLATPTPVRVVCQNTLSMALSRSRHVQSVRHDGRARESMEEARQVIRFALDEGRLLEQAARQMLHRKVSVADFDALVARHFIPLDDRLTPEGRRRRLERRHELRVLFRDAPTQEVGRGTAWAAFNAVAEWSEWTRPRHPHSAAAARSALRGRAADLRHKAFRVWGPPDVVGQLDGRRSAMATSLA
jgi:phage/plasmid-like protein (TIGR03299 family)